MNVLIIGDVMIDAYLIGQVDRISPEAPVPVVAVTRKEHRMGGAANVALNIQAMGANPILCSAVGNDDGAVSFIKLLKKAGMRSDGILKMKGRMTTVKTRVIGGKHQMMRIDEELDRPMQSNHSKLLLTFTIAKILRN